MWKGVLLTYLSHHAQTVLAFPSERDCSNEDGKSWKGIRGQRMGRAWASAQHRVSWLEGPGWGLICIQAASLVGETGLACRPDESGKSSRRGVTMSGTTLQRAGLRGEGLGELPRGFMSCICLFIVSVWETNNFRKASKEVHIMLVTPEKTCISLLGNVCLSSVQHLF